MHEKFVAQSLTFWGIVVTTLSSILPVVGPFVDITLSATDIAEIGTDGEAFINSVGTSVGLLMAMWGRIRAKVPLTFRTGQ